MSILPRGQSSWDGHPCTEGKALPSYCKLGISYSSTRRWDILPLIVNTDGGEPVWRDMPEDTVLEVKISHPTLTWFEEMDLRWYVAAASNPLP